MKFEELIQQNEAHRNEQWEKDFLAQFPEQKVVLESEEVRMGSDSWPYLFVRSESNSTEPVWKVIEWLSQKGVGLALNTHKQIPDYIFTYGMIWFFKEEGVFHKPSSEASLSKKAQFEEGQKIISGPPNAQYIPPYVREILKEFFLDQELKEGVRWSIVSADGKHYDLCFSLESLGNPKKEEHQGIAETLSWFFPTHFSIVLVSETYFPKFYDLDESCLSF